MLSNFKLITEIRWQGKPQHPHCQIDSGCQVSLAKSLALPSFYWEKTTDCGAAIQGTPIALTAKSKLFPVQFGEVKDELTLYRLDEISEDCILGVEWIHKVSPYLVDTKKMVFTCTYNDQTIALPIYFRSTRRCQSYV